MSRLSPHETTIAKALAAAAMPSGTHLEGGGDATLPRLERWLAQTSPAAVRGIRAMLWAAEGAAVTATGRPFSLLPVERATALLESWQTSPRHSVRSFVRMLLTPLKTSHFDDAAMFAKVGCPHGDDREPVRDEPARWMQKVQNGREVDSDLELECEVVVVGSGAGGAACAHELASRGHAVLLLEEGDFHRRSTFTTRAAEMSSKLYRDHGLTAALGNVGIPVWAGRAVGGTTLINSGTCYRTPEKTFERWRKELGLSWFTSDAMSDRKSTRLNSSHRL